MSRKSEPQKKSTGARVLRLVINPLSPVKSMKDTVGTGATVIRELHAEVTKRRKPTIRTFEEAMALRPPDALPLHEIERTNLNCKRIGLVFSLLSFVYSVGSIVPGNFFAVILGLLFSAFSLLVTFKHGHRVWQIRHRELISVRDFLHQPSCLLDVLNPELFN
jgi:hypothetical protein